MYRRKCYCRRWRRVCLSVILSALLLRLVTSPGITARIGSRCAALGTDSRFISLLLYLEFGCSGDCPEVNAPQAGSVTVRGSASTQAQAQDAEVPSGAAQVQNAASPLSFSQSDLRGINIVGNCTYSVDQWALLQQPLSVHFSGSGPKVLIVHTHASEAYTPSGGSEYDASGEYRTSDSSCNVIRVGEEIAAVLEENGISVLHDTTLNDADGYSDAYDRMGERIADYLSRYPSIQMVLDVHRDAFSNADGTPAGTVCTVSGEESAQLMLVMGTDQGGLYHPDWQENLSCALKLQALLQRTYPGLCRDLALRCSRYNQELTPCSMLVEVGATGNTLPQALTAARAFAEAVSALILSCS